MEIKPNLEWPLMCHDLLLEARPLLVRDLDICKYIAIHKCMYTLLIVWLVCTSIQHPGQTVIL